MLRSTSLRVFTFLAFCFFCGETLHAEIPPKFSNLSVLQGLSQNSVWCILRDRQGFLWFGTDDGLNKYDGYQFLLYRTRKDDSTSISQNTVRALIQDKRGAIWIGTSAGLNVYNPATDKFRRVRLASSASRVQPRMVITALAEDASGDIWVGTLESGLYRLSADGTQLKHYAHDRADSSSLSGNTIKTIYIDKAGTLWIGTEGAGINRYHRATNSFVAYKAGAGEGSLRDNSVYSFFEDSKGRFWAGTLYDGVLQFDRSNGKCRYFSKSAPPSDGRMDTLSVLTIAEDRNGRIIYGTFGAGLKFLQPETGAITTWKNDLRDPGSLSSSFIISIHRDDLGSLWIGTYTNGVCKWDPAGEHFMTYRNEIPHTTLFTDNNMRTIFRDRKGLLWIGSAKGLNVFNPATGACEQYRYSAKDPASISDDYVISVLEDSQGAMWIGTRNGLNLFDRSKKKFTRLKDQAKYPRALTSSNIRAIVEDRFGIIWFGTAMGVVSYDRRTDKFKTYPHNGSDPKTVSNDNIRSIFEDHTGTIWIGAYGGGINRFDRASETFTSYTHDPNNPKSISSDLAAPIKEDQHGNLWIGTYGGGVNKFDPRTESFTTYTETEGLTNNTIFGIEVDGKGNVWITTNRGVSCLNTATNKFRNYTTAAGLQGEEFNLNSSFKDADGTLYFGGNFGFNMFHPDRIRDNTFIPPVYITSLTIFNRPLRLDSAVTMKKEVVLSYDENSIGFEFVALNYRKSESNQYKYMLEGFDKEWIESGSTRKVSYTNLLPGEYVFRVMGSNNDGLWNPNGAWIRIVVNPPFWRTWWAYILYVLVLGGALLGGLEFLQRRQRRILLMEQQRHEAEVVRQKNIKLKEANDEILRQQDILKERNEQIEKANKELQDQIEQREMLLSELKTALENVKTLGGLIPICSSCKKIRDDEGYWNILETYLIKHSDAQFSHGICPDCAEKLYPKYARKQGEKAKEDPV